MKYIYALVLLTFFYSLGIPSGFAQQIPPPNISADVSAEAKAISRQRMPDIPKPRAKVDIDEPLQEEDGIELPKKEIFIKEIEIEGNTVVSREEILEITQDFQNRNILLSEISECAKQITALYRSKGYVTSQAYIPPQKIEEGIVKIKILEGKVGEIQVEGQKWFKEYSIKRLVGMKSQQVLRAQDLERSLLRLNRNPDLSARSVLAPSEIEESTDIIVKIEDKFPIHVGHQFDNLGTKFSGRNRQNIILTHNNFLTLNDRLVSRVLLSNSLGLVGISASYNVPINSKGWEAGLNFSHVQLSLGKSLEPLEILGGSTTINPTLSIPLFVTSRFEGSMNFGVDISKSRTRILAREDSLDQLRVLRFGPNITQYDQWGRTILTNEVSFGFSSILGASDKKDENASRAQTGGQFFAYSIGAIRFQRLWWDQILILKGSAQVSPDRLVSSEQFRIGGMETVRGYPEGDYLGDYGFIGSAELRIPTYFFPKKPISIFGHQINLRDTFQLVGFFDTGRAWLQSPLNGERDNKFLAGAGGGVLMNLFNHVSARVYFAQAIGAVPNEGDQFRLHFTLTSDF